MLPHRWPTLPWLLPLWAALCLGQQGPAGGPPPAPEAEAAPAWPLHICTAPWLPMVQCSPGNASAQFTGFDVEMLRRAAAYLQLREGGDFVFLCLPDFTSMLASLSDGDGNCSLAVAGITVTTQRQQMGIKFSYPYLKSSLGVLVKATTHGGSGWAWVQPFAPSLWLALGITLLVVPVAVFLLELLSLKHHVSRGDWGPGLQESFHRTLLMMLMLDPFMVSALAARVVVVCFGFLALLVMSTYTANLAAFVTVTHLKSSINDIKDLRGKLVASHGPYIELLRQQYGIVATEMAFRTGQDQEELGQLVGIGALDAAVDDLPAMEYVASTAPGCDLRVLSQQIGVMDYAVAAPPSFPDALLARISAALLQLQEDGALSQLQDNFMTPTDANCSLPGEVSRSSAAVSFMDVWGLFVVLAGGIAVGAVLTVVRRALRRRQHAAQRRRAGGGDTGWAGGGGAKGDDVECGNGSGSESPGPAAHPFPPPYARHSVASIGHQQAAAWGEACKEEEDDVGRGSRVAVEAWPRPSAGSEGVMGGGEPPLPAAALPAAPGAGMAATHGGPGTPCRSEPQAAAALALPFVRTVAGGGSEQGGGALGTYSRTDTGGSSQQGGRGNGSVCLYTRTDTGGSSQQGSGTASPLRTYMRTDTGGSRASARSASLCQAGSPGAARAARLSALQNVESVIAGPHVWVCECESSPKAAGRAAATGVAGADA